MRVESVISTALAGLALISRPVTAQNISQFRDQCLSFTPDSLIANSTLQILEYVPANSTLLFPDNDASCDRPSQVVQKDLCRVALHIATSNQSSIVYEHWLPSNWSGRLLGTGNGGIDGCKFNCFCSSRSKYTLQSGFHTILLINSNIDYFKVSNMRT